MTAASSPVDSRWDGADGTDGMEDANPTWEGTGRVDGNVVGVSGVVNVCGSVERIECTPVKCVGALVKIAFVPDCVDTTITPGDMMKSGRAWR